MRRPDWTEEKFNMVSAFIRKDYLWVCREGFQFVRKKMLIAVSLKVIYCLLKGLHCTVYDYIAVFRGPVELKHLKVQNIIIELAVCREPSTQTIIQTQQLTTSQWILNLGVFVCILVCRNTGDYSSARGTVIAMETSHSISKEQYPKAPWSFCVIHFNNSTEVMGCGSGSAAGERRVGVAHGSSTGVV